MRGEVEDASGALDGREQGCAALAATQAVKRLRRTWTTPILTVLLDGPQRFNALRRRLAPISAKVLAQRLEALRAQGLVSRCERVSAPPKEVVYALTSQGETVRGALDALAAWHRGLEASEAPQLRPPSAPPARAPARP